MENSRRGMGPCMGYDSTHTLWGLLGTVPRQEIPLGFLLDSVSPRSGSHSWSLQSLRDLDAGKSGSGAKEGRQ